MYSIEWVAYDLHSGLHSIFWKLYDNFTGEDIIHGHDDIPAQGHTRVSTIKHINMLFFHKLIMYTFWLCIKPLKNCH